MSYNNNNNNNRMIVNGDCQQSFLAYKYGYNKNHRLIIADREENDVEKFLAEEPKPILIVSSKPEKMVNSNY
ncbi:hypothetical protein DERP_011992 [Dermatophagoides pteronyssinus]|uniref:Uncharacterized protein n=1 Tax=Dermatophagoides pteronyssinus TaxID=6956 RepID=A0ABQ8IWA6_DERPT|nr:hypothetical protein DERP_011992 [Dermatophagoides pteronyssinus]